MCNPEPCRADSPIDGSARSFPPAVHPCGGTNAPLSKGRSAIGPQTSDQAASLRCSCTDCRRRLHQSAASVFDRHMCQLPVLIASSATAVTAGGAALHAGTSHALAGVYCMLAFSQTAAALRWLTG